MANEEIIIHDVKKGQSDIKSHWRQPIDQQYLSHDVETSYTINFDSEPTYYP